MESNKQQWRPSADLISLQRRSEIVWSIRSFFQAAGFWEVHTPLLCQDTILDRYIEPLSVPGEFLAIPGLENIQFYLQTSPEFAMKRLLAAGAEKIYQIGSVFRAGERGPLHNPEFTMLEWYRCGDNFEQGIQFLKELIQCLLPGTTPQQASYQSLFLHYVGLCPLTCDDQSLVRAARKRQLTEGHDWSSDRDDWLNLLFSELVQPNLGMQQPIIVTHYPASQSALARIAASDPRVSERYELFAYGVELANGYHELIEPEELRQRIEKVRQQRVADGKPEFRENSRLIQAMKDGMPSCSGCALGLDRMIMVIQRAQSIDQVIAFPIEIA